MSHAIVRREFLKRGILAAAALPGLQPVIAAASLNEIERTGAAKKVIVIGAGLAGLSSAYELAQPGHDVTVLEARTRSGGRVWTLRDSFPEGLHAEAGATNVFRQSRLDDEVHQAAGRGARSNGKYTGCSDLPPAPQTNRCQTGKRG